MNDEVSTQDQDPTHPSAERPPAGHPSAGHPSAGHPSAGHPDVQRWVAYYAGELPAAEHGEMQSHLTACPRCVELVLDLDAFNDPRPGRSAGVSDFEKAAVWRTLSGRARKTHRQGAAAGIAASLLVAALGLSAWSAQRRATLDLEARIAELSQPQVNAVVRELRLGSRQRSAGETEATTVLPTAATVLLSLNLEEPPEHPDYELEVLGATGAAVWSRRGLEPTEFGNFYLALPAGALPAGSYDLRLFGLEEGTRTLLEVYPVRLE